MEAYVAREDRSRGFSKYPPPGVDAREPNIARVYDAFLGGQDNDAPPVARANRSFLRRVVRYLTGEAGMTQLLDIGSGLPTAGNVHEGAHELHPQVRPGDVGNHPGGHVPGEARLAARQTTEVVTADVRWPAEIIGHPEIRGFLDFSEPMGLLLIAVLHHVGDRNEPDAIMAALRGALPHGSYLAISSFAQPGPEYPEEQGVAREVERILHDQLGTGDWRPADAGRGWFGDWTMIEPGLVPLSQWRPDPAGDAPSPLTHGLIGGVARKV